MSQYQDDLISKAVAYKRDGLDLPLDLQSDLMQAGICPHSLMSYEDQDQMEASEMAAEEQLRQEMQQYGFHEIDSNGFNVQ